MHFSIEKDLKTKNDHFYKTPKELGLSVKWTNEKKGPYFFINTVIFNYPRKTAIELFKK